MDFSSKEAKEIQEGLDNIESLVNQHYENIKTIVDKLPEEDRYKLEQSLEGLSHVYSETENLRVNSSNINNERYTDNLTRLYNRNALDDYVENLKDETYMIFMDLNNFKKANDEMGHDIGDSALKELGDTIQPKELESIRRNIGGMLTTKTKADDLVVRYGGDEFLVIPENIKDKDTAVNIAYRLKDTINSNFERFNEKYGTEIGVSVGLAKIDPERFSIKETKEYADRAMYASKQKKHLKEQPIAIYEDGVFEYAKIDKDNIIYTKIDDI